MTWISKSVSLPRSVGVAPHNKSLLGIANQSTNSSGNEQRRTMKKNQLEWGQGEFHQYIISYPTGAGNRTMGADSSKELLELFDEYPIGYLDDAMSLEYIRSKVVERASKGENLKLRYSNNYYLVELAVSCPIHQWIERDEDYNVYWQAGLLTEPKLVLTLPIKYSIPIGASDKEIRYRRNFAGQKAEEAFHLQHRKESERKLLAEADEWISKQDLSDPRIKGMYAYVVPVSYGDFLQKYQACVVLDIGGEHDGLKYVSSFSKWGGGQHSGYDPNPYANPRANGGVEEWEKLINKFRSGNFNLFISNLPKAKKVIASPKRLAVS